MNNSPQVLVLNGPNLGRLGSREPEVYGTLTYSDLERFITRWAQDLGLRAEVRQSDDESQLMAWIYEAIDSRQHIVINPAAFTHYSYALRDAAAQVTSAGLQLVEVHISNPSAREDFRAHSVISGVASGVIAGFGLDSYRLALASLAGNSSHAR